MSPALNKLFAVVLLPRRNQRIEQIFSLILIQKWDDKLVNEEIGGMC